MLRPATTARAGSPTTEEPEGTVEPVALDAADANAIEVRMLTNIVFQVDILWNVPGFLNITIK